MGGPGLLLGVRTPALTFRPAELAAIDKTGRLYRLVIPSDRQAYLVLASFMFVLADEKGGTFQKHGTVVPLLITGGRAAAEIKFLYATGAGSWNVPYPDGALVLRYPPPQMPSVSLVAPVSATIAGQPATVITAIAQSGQTSGMLEIDVVVPDDVSSGTQSLILKIGDKDNSEQKVVVWVQ